MPKARVPVRFKSEADEAEWYDRNQAWLLERFKEATARGTLQRGTAADLLRGKSDARSITMRMRVSDIERARRLSAARGIGYQTYMKMLLCEALDREEGLAGKRGRRRRAG